MNPCPQFLIGFLVPLNYHYPFSLGSSNLTTLHSVSAVYLFLQLLRTHSPTCTMESVALQHLIVTRYSLAILAITPLLLFGCIYPLGNSQCQEIIKKKKELVCPFHSVVLFSSQGRGILPLYQIKHKLMELQLRCSPKKLLLLLLFFFGQVHRFLFESLKSHHLGCY